MITCQYLSVALKYQGRITLHLRIEVAFQKVTFLPSVVKTFLIGLIKVI